MLLFKLKKARIYICLTNLSPSLLHSPPTQGFHCVLKAATEAGGRDWESLALSQDCLASVKFLPGVNQG